MHGSGINRPSRSNGSDTQNNSELLAAITGKHVALDPRQIVRLYSLIPEEVAAAEDVPDLHHYLKTDPGLRRIG